MRRIPTILLLRRTLPVTLLLAASLAPACALAQPAASDSFPVPLASFATTLIGSGPARTANVRLAAAALDGQVIVPGEELSFNRVVGPRTAERGYQEAPVILREVRDLQRGGGICQVASTLFAAGLLAGLTPVERHRHSSPVDYTALGEDATIAWGAKDLRLRNDGETPMRVRVELVGRSLGVRFEGADPLADRFELETAEHEIPVASADGAGLPGREVELYRVRHTADGSVDRELIARDLYPSSRPAGEKRSP
jgi:vancomycin resistance protein YoaR